MPDRPVRSAGSGNSTSGWRPQGLGVVSAATPEATDSGTEILKKGGNAADAAVAVSFALAVSEPAMSGLGGQTQILLFSPEAGGIAINGTSFAPKATPTQVLPEDLNAHRATTVPTTVKVLEYLWRRFGSGKLDWAELIQPAINHAERGFTIGPFRHRVFIRHHLDLKASQSAGALFLRPDGRLPEPGEIFRQGKLGSTLQQIAEGGSESFYRGLLAREISRDVEQHGGWMRFGDLAALSDPIELVPVRGMYRDYDVWSFPPPGGGWAVLEVLKTLEKTSPEELRPEHPERLPTLARALHLGQEERLHNPLEGRVARIERAEDSGETTHFSIIDRNGMALSVSASLNTYFGSKVAHPELGFLYNDYMNEFVLGQSGHLHSIGPSAVPFSSMSPTILTQNGEVCLVAGSPGSERIVSAVSQVIQLWVDTPLDLDQVVAWPRIHCSAARELFVEALEADSGWADALIADGFVPIEPARDVAIGDRNAFFGGVHAVGIELGHWVGAADPRRDGTVGVAR